MNSLEGADIMRKNHKIMALCLIAVMMVSMLSACAGKNYGADAEHVELPLSVSQLVDDIEVTENKGETIKYVDAVDTTPGTSGSQTNNNSSSEGENTQGDENQDTETENNSQTNNNGGDYEIDNRDYSTTCMSFNVLQYDTWSMGFAQPNVRAAWVVDTINKYDPDLIGTQEVTHDIVTQVNGFDMYDYLIQQLSGEYSYRAIDQEPDDQFRLADQHIGCGLIIFWKTSRFELKDSGCVAYTKDVNRYVQWVKLYDKQEKITIFMTNTHWSIDPGNGSGGYDISAGQAMRSSEASELFTLWDKNCGDGVPLYATGDFNHYSSEPCFDILNKGRFVSSREVSNSSNGESELDYIYINGDVQGCFEYLKITDTYEPTGVPKQEKQTDSGNIPYRPSDHWAIMAYCTNEYL